jgi:hypothetical protein
VRCGSRAGRGALGCRHVAVSGHRDRLGGVGERVRHVRRRHERAGDGDGRRRLARLLRDPVYLRGCRVTPPAPDPHRPAVTAPSGHALPIVDNLALLTRHHVPLGGPPPVARLVVAHARYVPVPDGL